MNDEILRLTVRRNGAFTTVDSAVGAVDHGTRHYGGHGVAGQGRGEALRDTMQIIRRVSPGAHGPLAWPHRRERCL